MAEDEDQHFAYLAIRMPDDDALPTFAFGRRAFIDEAVKKWTGDSDDHDKPAAAAAEEPEFTHASALTDALKASVDFGLAQHELIEAANIAPLFLRIAMVRGGFIAQAKKSGVGIEENESYKLIGLKEADYTEMTNSFERYIIAKKGFERFASATLLSIVATFDTLVVDILSKMLTLQTDWLERSERSVTLSRLAAATDLNELIQEQISEEVYQFSRGSHTEQAAYIKRNFQTDIEKDWKRWPDYIEIFERRNLVAHGETKFNKRYVRICTEAGHKGSAALLGETVELRTSYLKQSLNVLIEFAALLSFSLFRKFVKEVEEQAFTNLNEAVFTLIKSGHYVVAERLSVYALGLKGVKVTSETRLMLIVNRASAVRHDGRVDEAKAILDGEDWSAVSDIFQIAVASVRSDVATFKALLPKLKGANELTAQSLLTWPCFAFMRQDPEGQEAIFEIFGVDVRKEKSERLADEIEDAATGEPLLEDKTVH